MERRSEVTHAGGMHIDHTVVLTRRHDETWRRYEQLDFRLSPPSRHLAAVGDQSEPVPSCRTSPPTAS
jgi:hypothetical protein